MPTHSLDLIGILPLIPLAGALAWAPVQRRWGPRIAGYIALGAAALAALGWILALLALADYVPARRTYSIVLASWPVLPNVELALRLHLDTLSAPFGLLTTLAGVAIMAFAQAQPEESDQEAWLLAALAAISFLLLAGNYVTLWSGWFILAVVTHLLLGARSRSSSGMMAVGSLSTGALGLAVLALLAAEGTTEFAAVSQAAQQHWVTDAPLAMGVGAALAFAALAQLGQSIWPTARLAENEPSATVLATLIGIISLPAALYLLLRSGGLLVQAPAVLAALRCLGLGLALAASLLTLWQRRLLRGGVCITLAEAGLAVAALSLRLPDLNGYQMMMQVPLAVALILVMSLIESHGHALPQPDSPTTHDQSVTSWRLHDLSERAPEALALLGIVLLAPLALPPFAGYEGKAQFLLHAYRLGHAELWWGGLLSILLLALYTGRLAMAALFPYRGRPTPDLRAIAHRAADWTWGATAGIVLVAAVGGSLFAVSIQRWLAPWFLAEGLKPLPRLWLVPFGRAAAPALAVLLGLGAAAGLGLYAIRRHHGRTAHLDGPLSAPRWVGRMGEALGTSLGALSRRLGEWLPSGKGFSLYPSLVGVLALGGLLLILLVMR